jgi:hypothetical protein
MIKSFAALAIMSLLGGLVVARAGRTSGTA